MSLLVYYGHDPDLLPRLRDCQVLIFEPRGWSPNHLEALKQPGGPRLLGYLSPLAWPAWAGPTRWWWGPSGPDPAWNARWYSLAWAGWRRQVRRQAQKVRESCHGLFLDNLDRLQTDSASLPHLRNLLRGWKVEWPEAYLLGNRGFTHLESLGPWLDGVLVENLTDRAFSPSDQRWVVQQLDRLEGTTDAYALDYANRCDVERAERLCRRYPNLRYYRAPDERLQSLG